MQEWLRFKKKYLFSLLQRKSDTKHLVAFVGNEGHLATSKTGGNTVSIWPPPVVESHVVWKSMFTIDIQGSVTRLVVHSIQQ